MFSEHPARPVAILDIGASRSHFSIFGRHGIEYAFSSGLAGNAITQNIAKEYNRSFIEAEQIKLAGKADGQEIDMIRQLDNSLKPLFDEVEKTINYHNTNNSGNVEAGAAHLERLIITGGSSKIKNIIDYINRREFSYTAELGSGLIADGIADNNYIQAIGSAIRGLDDSWEYTDPFLSLHNHEARKIARSIKTELDDFLENRLKLSMKKLVVWFAVVFFVLATVFSIPIVKNFNKEKADTIGYFNQSFKTYLNILGGDDQSDQKIFKARIIKISTEKPLEATELLEQQKIRAKVALLKNELLSPEPINKAILEGSLVFPLTLEWLAYDENEIKSHCLKQGQMKFSNPDLMVAGAYITNLEIKTGKKDLNGTGYCEVVSGKELLERPEIIKPAAIIKKEKSYIKIDQIGSKLNIRSGPSTSFAVVGSAEPGSEYEFLEQRDGWMKINFESGKDAWVNANFVKKISK
jgi:hypothetical protein